MTRRYPPSYDFTTEVLDEALFLLWPDESVPIPTDTVDYLKITGADMKAAFGGGGDISAAIIKAPNSAGRNTVTPTGDYSNTIYKQILDQTAEVWVNQLSDGTPVAWNAVDGSLHSKAGFYTDNAEILNNGQVSFADGYFEVTTGGSVHSYLDNGQSFSIYDIFNEKNVLYYTNNNSTDNNLYFDPARSIYISANSHSYYAAFTDEVSGQYHFGIGAAGAGEFRTELNIDGSAKFANGATLLNNNYGTDPGIYITYVDGGTPLIRADLENDLSYQINYEAGGPRIAQLVSNGGTPGPTEMELRVYDGSDSYGLDIVGFGDGTGRVTTNGSMTVNLPYTDAAFVVYDYLWDANIVSYNASAAGTNPVYISHPGGLDVSASISGVPSSSSAFGGRWTKVDIRQTFSDSDVTILATTDVLVSLVPFTGAHTLTLPLAADFGSRSLLVIEAGGGTGLNGFVLSGGDAFIGSSNPMITNAYGSLILQSDGVSSWQWSSVFNP